MLVWPYIAEIDGRKKEDYPQSQEDQQAVPNRHDALVVAVAGGVRQSCCLRIIQIVAIAANNTSQLSAHTIHVCTKFQLTSHW